MPATGEEKSPVDKVIAAFGGVDAAAKAAGVPTKRVHAWAAPVEQRGGGGRIPAKHQGRILVVARRRRIRLAAEDLIDMRHVRAAEDCQ